MYACASMHAYIHTLISIHTHSASHNFWWQLHISPVILGVADANLLRSDTTCKSSVRWLAEQLLIFELHHSRGIQWFDYRTMSTAKYKYIVRTRTAVKVLHFVFSKHSLIYLAVIQCSGPVRLEKDFHRLKWQGLQIIRVCCLARDNPLVFTREGLSYTQVMWVWWTIHCIHLILVRPLGHSTCLFSSTLCCSVQPSLDRNVF